MKKTILYAALAATVLAGSALAQPGTPQPGATPSPSPTTPSTTMPSTNPPSTMPSKTSPSTMPSTTGSTPNPAGSAVLIDRQKTGDAMSSELVGAAVYSATGDRIGDVNDLVIDGSGRIAGVVIGVGGFLGMGEKNVAVDYTSVLKSRDDSGRARLTINLTKDALKTAAPFVPMKKS